MKIIVELTLLDQDNPTPEEIEKDIRMGEDQIGWNYSYSVESVSVV